MALRYVTTAGFKQSVSIPDSATDSDVNMALLAAENAIHEITQRRFWKDAAPVTRTYTAVSCRRVNIDDAADIDSVTVSGAAITDYLSEPLNALADGKPYLWLTSASGAFSTTPGSIQVTGTFGWPSVPDQVPQMVTILASKLLKRTREAPFGFITTGSIEGIAVRLAREDPDLHLLIEPLMRYSMWVA